MSLQPGPRRVLGFGEPLATERPYDIRATVNALFSLERSNTALESKFREAGLSVGRRTLERIAAGQVRPTERVATAIEDFIKANRRRQMDIAAAQRVFVETPAEDARSLIRSARRDPDAWRATLEERVDRDQAAIDEFLEHFATNPARARGVRR